MEELYASIEQAFYHLQRQNFFQQISLLILSREIQVMIYLDYLYCYFICSLWATIPLRVYFGSKRYPNRISYIRVSIRVCRQS